MCSDLSVSVLSIAPFRSTEEATETKAAPYISHNLFSLA